MLGKTAKSCLATDFSSKMHSYWENPGPPIVIVPTATQYVVLNPVASKTLLRLLFVVLAAFKCTSESNKL